MSINILTPDKQLGHRKQIQLLIVILSISVVLRVGSAFYLGNEVVNLPGTFDQISYHNLAIRVIDGYGFTFGEKWWPVTDAGEPTAHWSFLYTFYLVIVYKIFGINPLVARLIQAVLVGILHPLFIFLIAKKVFGTITGLIAAAITVIYVYFIYYSASLMTEAFYITGILASIYLGIVAADGISNEQDNITKQSTMMLLGLGITLGITVLLRQLFLLFIPFLLGWILIVGYIKCKRLFLRYLLIPLLLIFLLVLPFAVFNYSRFNQFVLLNTNAGYAFFWANHPIYGSKFVPILESTTYQELIPPELLYLNEAALDSALLLRGIQFIQADPLRYIQLSFSRIPIYFMFWPSSDSGFVSNLSRVLSFGIFLPFMLYGLILTFIRSKKKLPDCIVSPLTILVTFILVYTMIHLLSWTLIRYRLPVDAILILFAATAIVDIAARITRSFRQDVVANNGLDTID
jgi:4-amino-4-deoxy-L-arabinose transferase-like glycosyltransferase